MVDQCPSLSFSPSTLSRFLVSSLIEIEIHISTTMEKNLGKCTFLSIVPLNHSSPAITIKLKPMLDHEPFTRLYIESMIRKTVD
jgi:hypothetical protein